MSDDLVARLRVEASADWRGYPPAAAELCAEAADRIEALEAERDTLAEIVRVGPLEVVMGEGTGKPYLGAEYVHITPEQAERFQAALDRITKEAGDG